MVQRVVYIVVAIGIGLNIVPRMVSADGTVCGSCSGWKGRSGLNLDRLGQRGYLVIHLYAIPEWARNLQPRRA